MKSFSYIIVPKNKSTTGTNIVIKDENPYILILLNKILDLKSNIYLGHSSWSIDSEVIDVKKVLKEYKIPNNNPSAIFNNFIKNCFKTNMGLFWGNRIDVKVYKKYFDIGYEKAISELSNNTIYDGLLYAADEHINNDKKTDNILYLNKK